MVQREVWQLSIRNLVMTEEQKNTIVQLMRKAIDPSCNYKDCDFIIFRCRTKGFYRQMIIKENSPWIVLFGGNYKSMRSLFAERLAGFETKEYKVDIPSTAPSGPDAVWCRIKFQLRGDWFNYRDKIIAVAKVLRDKVVEWGVLGDVPQALIPRENTCSRNSNDKIVNSEDLKTFQDWCIDTLYMILKEKARYSGSLDDQGYKYTLKAIVDHYASMYYCGRGAVSRRNGEKEHINLWWDHLNNGTRVQFFSPLLMSSAAADYCLNPFRNIREFGGQGGKLHLEHITPKGYVYNKLQRLSEVTREAIAGCFKHCKLVLLTKDETDKYLDGKSAAFSESDVAMLHDVFHVDRECLEEAVQLVGKSPKSNGAGLLRMVRLYNSGVRFCNSQRKKIEPKDWLSYLNNANYEI